MTPDTEVEDQTKHEQCVSTKIVQTTEPSTDAEKSTKIVSTTITTKTVEHESTTDGSEDDESLKVFEKIGKIREMDSEIDETNSKSSKTYDQSSNDQNISSETVETTETTSYNVDGTKVITKTVITTVTSSTDNKDLSTEENDNVISYVKDVTAVSKETDSSDYVTAIKSSDDENLTHITTDTITKKLVTSSPEDTEDDSSIVTVKVTEDIKRTDVKESDSVVETEISEGIHEDVEIMEIKNISVDKQHETKSFNLFETDIDSDQTETVTKTVVTRIVTSISDDKNDSTREIKEEDFSDEKGFKMVTFKKVVDSTKEISVDSDGDLTSYEISESGYQETVDKSDSSENKKEVHTSVIEDEYDKIFKKVTTVTKITDSSIEPEEISNEQALFTVGKVVDSSDLEESDVTDTVCKSKSIEDQKSESIKSVDESSDFAQNEKAEHAAADEDIQIFKKVTTVTKIVDSSIDAGEMSQIIHEITQNVKDDATMIIETKTSSERSLTPDKIHPPSEIVESPMSTKDDDDGEVTEVVTKTITKVFTSMSDDGNDKTAHYTKSGDADTYIVRTIKTSNAIFDDKDDPTLEYKYFTKDSKSDFSETEELGKNIISSVTKLIADEAESFQTSDIEKKDGKFSQDVTEEKSLKQLEQISSIKTTSEKTATEKIAENTVGDKNDNLQKELLETENISGDITFQSIRSISSQSTESTDMKEEKSSKEKVIQSFTTTTISEPTSVKVLKTITMSQEDDDKEQSPSRKSSKKKEPRIVKKKIIVYHTGPETAEEFLTEDRIREAIRDAGGKASSTSVTRIVSSGTTEDMEKFAGDKDVIEVKSISDSFASREKHETTTESSTKHETIETTESIEIDPFSLITKPLEEVFRRRMIEQKQEDKVSETTLSESKESTKLEEKTIEVIERKDTGIVEQTLEDRKVATDAKKLKVETIRREEASESAQTSTSIQRSTDRLTSDIATIIETRSDTTSTDTESRTETDESSSGKSFNLDEWDKPMGLPSPIETLDIEDNATIFTKQHTTTSGKENGNYSEIKQDKSMKETDETSPTKPDEEEKSERGRESPSEKVRRHADNKEAENSQDPIYIDLTYVPHFGDPHYCNADFFRRIRSRYYVFSGSKPSKEVFNALLEAKQQWKDKDAKVTIIPTYETDTLGYWMAVNQETLIANNIDVAPSASRCTINLQDHETSCSAYRLEL